MDATTMTLETDWSPIAAGPCVTSEAALWRWLRGLAEGEQLVLALCVESTAPRSRRRARQERSILALRFGGRIRLLDSARPEAPLVELDGAHDLARYFDDADGFAYVEVRARRLRG